MFDMNKAKHKVKSGYEDKMADYTISLPQATREEQEKAEQLANEINRNARDKVNERVRQGHDAEARGNEIEEVEEQLFAAASSVVPANSANEEHEAHRLSRASGVPIRRVFLASDGSRFRSSGAAGGGSKRNRDHRGPVPRDRDRERGDRERRRDREIDNECSKDSSYNQNWCGVSQPEASSSNSLSLDSRQTCLGFQVTQPPAIPESPQCTTGIATLSSYAAQFPQNPSRQQQQQHQQHQFQSPPPQQQIINSGAADNPTDFSSHMTANVFAGQVSAHWN